MLDTVIRGGQVVTPDGVRNWDVAIHGERIVAVTAPNSLTEDVARVIDASGKLVIPGGVDPHVHTSWRQIRPGGEGFITGAPLQVTRAALYGGTTTVVGFVLAEEGQTLAQSIARQDEAWHESYVDYALHVTLRGAVSPEIIDQIPETISAGYPSFKVFTTNVIPGRRGLKVEMMHICSIMEQLARHGGILSIHAEDDDILNYMLEKLRREGRMGAENLALVHSPVSEDLAFRRIIRFARHVEGAALYMLHVSAKTGVDAIAEARADGYPVYGETLHNYVCFTADIYRQPDGVLYHTYPSLKYEEDRRSLWAGLRDGVLGSIATDEVSTPRAVKLEGRTVADAIGGHAGIETRMAIAYTEGVCKLGLSLERFVAVTSTNAAKILGLYPQKGAIAAGSDADLVIFDPAVRKSLRAEELHDTDYSIWEGREVYGWPLMTLLRGAVVVDQGELIGHAGEGCRIAGKLAPAILNGPAVS